jgi:hypothetical protein
VVLGVGRRGVVAARHYGRYMGKIMKQVPAFKCEYTGKIFESEQGVRRQEFYELMKKFTQQLPVVSGVTVATNSDLAMWLSDKLVTGIYPSAIGALMDAVEYLTKYRDVIEGKKT